jgi:DNA-binding NarL/FixJ family response regulator
MDQRDDAEIARRFGSLTKREREVCLQMVQGALSKQIADTLSTSINTVKKHRMAVLNKMQSRSLVDLVRMLAVLETGNTMPPVKERTRQDDQPSALSILVVEDDPSLRAAMLRALSGFGHRVHALDSGRDALSVVARQGIDIVVLDIMLGDDEEDGLHLARRLRTQFHGGIIMATALGERATRLKGLTEAADAYLVKPIDFDELQAVLQSLGRRLTTSGEP